MRVFCVECWYIICWRGTVGYRGGCGARGAWSSAAAAAEVYKPPPARSFQSLRLSVCIMISRLLVVVLVAAHGTSSACVSCASSVVS